MAGDDGDGGDGDADLQQGRAEAEAVVARLVGSAFAQQGFALGLQLLGFLLHALGVVAFLLGDGGELDGVVAAGRGGDRIHVLLQALGLVEVPLVGGLVLGQHRLVGVDDGAAVLDGLQAAGHRGDHCQEGDGDRDQ